MNNRHLLLLLALMYVTQAWAQATTPPLDPFEQATTGDASCRIGLPEPLTLEQIRTQAHGRVERGTSCQRDPNYKGWCPKGGAYALDRQINAAVVNALRQHAVATKTSIWVGTSRGFVTLQGCVNSAAEKQDLEQFVSKLPDVQTVFNQLVINNGVQSLR